jgi:iron complex transport system substrate-binding protein
MDVVDALLAQAPRTPQRIVALTEETTETLYRLGLGDRIVGVTCFTLRPPEAKQKPTVSSFLDANFERIIELRPDLVVGFSDLQGEIARELAKRGVPVVIFNQRSVAEVLQTITSTAALVGAAEAGARLVDELVAHVRNVAEHCSRRRRVRVFFEEWAEPTISAIRWVSELIEIAGGDDLFRETRARHDARGRFVSVDDVIARDPEVIIASWCGKKVKRDSIVERYAATSAVKNDAIYEIPSELILQPGPACLTDGLDALARILDAVAAGTSLPPAAPGEARRGDV